MLFAPKEKGQGLVEYAIILFLVAIVVLASLRVLGPMVIQYEGSGVERLVVRYGPLAFGGFVVVFLGALSALYVWDKIKGKGR